MCGYQTVISPFLRTQDDLCSPLHVACVNSHYAMAKLLMMNGASIHDEDADGMTPILRLLIIGISSPCYSNEGSRAWVRACAWGVVGWGHGWVGRGEELLIFSFIGYVYISLLCLCFTSVLIKAWRKKVGWINGSFSYIDTETVDVRRLGYLYYITASYRRYYNNGRNMNVWYVQWLSLI